MKTLFSILVILVFCCQNIFSQAPGCPNVYAGPDTIVDCNTVSCVQLTANYLNVGQTTSYAVTSTPYAPPYPFLGGTQLFIGIDDVWSSVISMPFNFCFFGNTYNQIVIGANGVISFDLSNAGGWCEWSFSNTIPNTTGEPYRNSINGAYHDMDPSISGGDINYAILGSYPCRTFVINYNNVPHFLCNSITTTQQIVLYETTNVIEVYINNKPTCTSWNSGNAVIGIQNTNGTIGYTPPGRNTGSWSTSNEAWRFTPNGPSICSVNWFQDGNPNPISTYDTVTVCPSSPINYIAEVTYTRCDQSLVIKKDTILINAGIQQGNTLDTIISCDTSIVLTADHGEHIHDLVMHPEYIPSVHKIFKNGARFVPDFLSPAGLKLFVAIRTMASKIRMRRYRQELNEDEMSSLAPDPDTDFADLDIMIHELITD